MDTNLQSTLVGGVGTADSGESHHSNSANNGGSTVSIVQVNLPDFPMRILDKPDEIVPSVMVSNLFGSIQTSGGSLQGTFANAFGISATPLTIPSPTTSSSALGTSLVISPTSSSSSSTSTLISSSTTSSTIAPSPMDITNSSSSNSNGCNTHQHKKCLYHRLCCRNQQTHQVQMMKLNENNTNSGSASSTNNNGAPNRNGSPTKSPRDAISTNLSPQLNAALLADRYLLMDLVEGSSLYRCIDIKTQEDLVCKVRFKIQYAKNTYIISFRIKLTYTLIRSFVFYCVVIMQNMQKALSYHILI